MKSNNRDYLKYWRIVRHYIKVRYSIGQGDLDLLLFLYSEKYFGLDIFQEYNNVLPWDNGRWCRLRKDGWIELFRKRYGKRKALYTLSYKAKRMITSMYKKLNGEENVVTTSSNPMYRKDTRFTNKVNRMMLTKMAEEIKNNKFDSPE